MKNILFGQEATDRMLAGFNKAADAVGGTIGPKGQNVFFDGEIPFYEITNDGATVADKVVLEDKEEDAGAYIIRNVTSQQNDDAGDGTTTVAVLTQAIVNECMKLPDNPVVIRESLNEAVGQVLKELAKTATKIKPEDIKKVALISAENEQIATMITEIITKLGDKAVINVEDSKTFASEYEIVDGYEAKAGFMSPHFVTDKKASKSIYEDVAVLVAEKKIQNIVDIAPLFEKFKETGINQCVIFCEDIEDSMLGVFVNSKLMGTFNALVVRAGGDTLKDIEGVVGAKRVSDATGVSFKTLTLQDLGHAKKVVADAHKTLIFGDPEAGGAHAQMLEYELAAETNRYSKESLEQRIAKLKGGIATLRIAAPTDPERIYLRRKAEDAVKATLAALEEGVVEGGGMALWRLADKLKANTVGQAILKKAMTRPLAKITENAGHDYNDIVRQLNDQLGYDAKNNLIVDMIEAGILDPAKVTRCALENAVSIAGTFITTFCLIVEAKDPKNERR